MLNITDYFLTSKCIYNKFTTKILKCVKRDCYFTRQSLYVKFLISNSYLFTFK